MHVEVKQRRQPALLAPRSDSPACRTGLPGSYYWSEEQFAEDLAKVFGGSWLFAAHAAECAEPGAFITLQIGRDSLVLVRGEDHKLRALFNSCRHRGSLICTAERGVVRRLVCPYHNWVYGLDGRLENCRLMGDEVDRDQFALHAAAVEEVCGFIFVCLAATPPDFRPARTAFESFLAPHTGQPVKVSSVSEYVVPANWKTIFDNNRECYHCAVSHEEFCLSNFDFGMPGDPRASSEFHAAFARMQARWAELGLKPGPVNFPDGQWFRLMRFPLRPGFVTESLDGQPVAPLIGPGPDFDLGSLRVVGLPNMWFHLNSDYFMTTRLIPTGPRETHVRVTWLVHAEAVAGRDYDPDRVAAVWRATSEQDWELCAWNQRGLESTRFTPGPLSQLTEQGVANFADWYLRQLDRSD